MKRIVLASLIILLATAGSAAASDFALFGSYWDTELLGETAGGGLKVGFGGGPVQFELRGSYFPDITEDVGELLDTDDDFDFELKVVPLEAGIKFGFGAGQSFRPYIGGGGSYFLLDTSVGEVDDEVGYYLVAGFEGGGGSVGFVAEAMYRSVEAQVDVDPEDFDDIDDIDFDDDVDLDLTGFAANVGIIWRF